jgi:hypothetical protein
MKPISLEAMFPNLFQFFAGYFHEDWKLDYQNPDQVVKDFIRNTSKGCLKLLQRELVELKARFQTEESLKRAIQGLGSHYEVTVDGYTFSNWITHLENKFDNSLN